MSLVGSQLGKYDITAEIGRGGMSVVYRARDRQLQRDVAIKVLHSFLAEQPEARTRFHREALAVASLHHPNIIQIHDYSSEDGGASYIVTELIDGMALSEVLRRWPIAPPEVALLLVRPVADALRCAHEAHIVHRDLKPENILIGRDGTLKLTDFGIARILDGQPMTMTGTLLGSPAYMAPEYIEGYATDERADIFSFGAMLYQLAVGKLPFEAPSPHALLKRIATGDYTPAQQANPSLHPELARIIDKALAKLPENRFASAAALLAELDRLLEQIGIAWKDELPGALRDPVSYGRELSARLGAVYLRLGKQCLAQKRIGAALEHLDRALGLDPKNVEVHRILRRMQRRSRLARAARAAALGVVGALLVTVLAGGWLARPGPAPAPLASASPAVEVPLAPSSARELERNVSVIVRGRGDLFVDGALAVQGLSRSQALLLSPGTHELRMVGAERSASVSVEVPADGPVQPIELDVTAALVRPSPRTDAKPAVTRSKEVVFNAANVVDVYVDGATEPLRERFGRFALPLTFGKHRVVFRQARAYDLELDVLVDEGNPPQTIVVKMQALPARLFVHGAPSGAVVEVEGTGKRVLINEQTRAEPIFVPLPLGLGAQEYDVIVRKDTQTFRRKMEFRAGGEQKLEVQLNPL